MTDTPSVIEEQRRETGAWEPVKFGGTAQQPIPRAVAVERLAIAHRLWPFRQLRVREIKGEHRG